MRGRVGILAANAALLLVSGCTALGVSVAGLGGAMVGAGAGAAVKAGTEYEVGGAVARTSPLPLADLRQSALATFERLDIDVDRASEKEEPDVLVGRAGRRTVRMKFEPVTNVLTRVQVTVNSSFLVKDLATAQELLVQLEAGADGPGVSPLRGR
jgi:hypothetical protein